MAWLEAVADPVRLAIVRHLATHEEATLRDLARVASAATETVRRHVRYLEHARVLEAVPPTPDGETRGRPPVRYRLRPGTLVTEPEMRSAVR